MRYTLKNLGNSIPLKLLYFELTFFELKKMYFSFADLNISIACKFYSWNIKKLSILEYKCNIGVPSQEKMLLICEFSAKSIEAVCFCDAVI